MMKRIELDDPAIIHLCSADSRLSELINRVGPIECSLHSDPFEFLVDEVIEQMLSVKVADIIRQRFVSICNNEITPEKIANLDIEDIRQAGISKQKASYIQNLSAVVNSGSLNLEELSLLSDNDVIQKLTALKGIGNWTAKMYLIFVLNRNDILPFEDAAFLQGFRWLYDLEKVTKAEVIDISKKWHPYSSIAARYLYRAVDMVFIKKE